MIKTLMVLAMMFYASSIYAGECVTGKCALRTRTVNITKEIISVPVEVTRRVSESVRQVGRRTLIRSRSVVR